MNARRDASKPRLPLFAEQAEDMSLSLKPAVRDFMEHTPVLGACSGAY